MKLYIQYQWVNSSEGYMIGESEYYEVEFESLKELFNRFKKECGKCTSSIFIDKEKNEKGETTPKKIGWVFQKKNKYEDVNKEYVRETWVTLHKEPPKKTIEFNYYEIN